MTKRQRTLHVGSKVKRRKEDTVVLLIDLRKKAVGTYLGGCIGFLVRCDACGAPAALMSVTRRLDGTHKRFAHTLMFRLSAKNEPQMKLTSRCISERSNGDLQA